MATPEEIKIAEGIARAEDAIVVARDTIAKAQRAGLTDLVASQQAQLNALEQQVAKLKSVYGSKR